MVDPLESAGLCRTGVLDLSKNLTEVQNGGSAGVCWSQKLTEVQNGRSTGVCRSMLDWSLKLTKFSSLTPNSIYSDQIQFTCNMLGWAKFSSLRPNS